MSGDTKAGPGKAQRKGRSAEGRSTAKGEAKGTSSKGGPPSGSKGGAKGSSKGGAKTSQSTSRVGRYTPPEQSGRYTAPTPRDVKRSPVWFGAAILALLVLGVLMILLNYLGVLPGSVTAWYLVAGLGMIFVGFMMATRYR